MSSIPDSFGLVSIDQPGIPISNKDTILNELDQATGRNKPPDLEYILIMPFSKFMIPGTKDWGFCVNTFGHSAIRYRLPPTPEDPNGRQILVNIDARKNRPSMVDFLDPKEYFYGTDEKLTGEQRGVYNRNMISLQVDHVPPEKIMAMHQYFLELDQLSQAGKHRFGALPRPIQDYFQSKIEQLDQKLDQVEERIKQTRPVIYGNCAKWSSEGLIRAGVITYRSYWPKAIWINMFENYQHTVIKTRENLKVISYRRIKHAKRAYGQDRSQVITQVAPLQTFRSLTYFNLEKFADQIVEVPEGETQAKITTIDRPKQPSNWRNFLNSKVMIGFSTIIMGGLIARQTGMIQASRYLSRLLFRRQLTRQNLPTHLKEARSQAQAYRQRPRT